MSLISSLILGDSPLSASTDVMQYSADGQISVVTRSAIFIVTPDFNAPSNQNGHPLQGNHLAWSKTAIHDFGAIKSWSDGRTEWSTLSLGTAENVWQAASWSPSGLNRLGGCLLASLTNNLQLAIWAPVKNPSTGEWTRVADITEYQIASYGGEDEVAPEDLLKCQSCSIAWSGSCHEGTTPLLETKNHSLLAVGARSGDLSFFRWDLSTDAARYCFNFKVADAWIIRLVWSKWKPVDDNKPSHFVQASLACGLSNGSVWVLNVKQGPGGRDGDEREQYSVIDSTLVIEPDSRSITAMAFVEMSPRSQPLLAVAKPGFVTLCNIPVPTENEMAEDPSLHTVMLSSPRTSLASSAVSTCVGLHYVPSDDSLVVILAEGSIVTIANVSQNACLREQGERPISTHGLSKAVRRITGVAENRPLERAEYARIYGIHFMGTENYALWGQEVLQSYDLSFRIQATYKTRICLVKLWEPDEDMNFRLATSLSVALSSHNLVTPYSPGVILNQIMFELLQAGSIVSAAPRLLPVLAPEWGLSNANQFANEENSASTNGDSLASQTRLKLSLVESLVNREGLPDNLTLELKSLLRALVETATALRIQAVVERIVTWSEGETADHTSALHFIHASQFCPIPSALSQRFQNMKENAGGYVRRHSLNLTYSSNDGEGMLDLSRAADLGEKCPACQQIVLFQNLAQARCQTGHVWGALSDNNSDLLLILLDP
ncbi:transcription factor IIIC subunit delta N-term-domain-containing protein [Rhizoctonia solani]|nr:transcription factor IIIC subunit delta N-term-domain-containing protein [Rhizoctonia solani]